jgi:L-2-hydroxyglutarate oxidase LhgO
MESADCVVIGAGVVGLAVARAMARKGREVLILESEALIGSITSARNSEVIHAGIHYPHGSLKERLCVMGRDMVYAFCDEYGITYDRATKLVVATDDSEIPQLRALQEHAAKGGVYMTWLTGEDARQIEPKLACAAALHSPLTGIVDSHGLMLAYLGDAEAHGASMALKSPVTGGRAVDGGIEIDVGGETGMSLSCRTVINCAGLGAQAVSGSIVGVKPDSIPKQYLGKGNYFYLSGRAPFKRLIYPLPGVASLGLHYTRDMSGQGRFGPDLQWTTELDYTVDENRAADFYAAIRRYWPDLPDGALRPGYAGIRPKIQAPGEGARDFMIQTPDQTGVNGFLALYGIESPGLTSSLAIAEYVAQRVP